MKKNIIKSVLIILAVIMLLSGCVGQFNDTPDDTKNNGTETDMEFKLDKDYVYYWRPEGVKGGPEVRFQSPKYALGINTSNGKFTAFGALKCSDLPYFEEADFAAIPAADTNFSVNIDSQIYPLKDISVVSDVVGDIYTRIIESGRYVQRLDMIKMNFDGLAGITGRLEAACFQDYFVLGYELFSDTARSDATLSFSIDLGTGYQEAGFNARTLTMKDQAGSGFTFLIDGQPNLSVAAQGSKVIFTAQNVSLPPLAHKGFSVKVIPSAKAKVADANPFLMSEDLDFTATQIAPVKGRNQNVAFRSYDGVYVIDGDNALNIPSITMFSDEKLRNAYDRIKFTVKNDSTQNLRIPVAVRRTSQVSITGMSPMLRDSDSLDPVGIPMQISKNWHYYSQDLSQRFSAAIDDPVRHSEGVWYMGYAYIDVPANSQKTYEYTCAYANWGGVPAASHAQLSLIGWTGYGVWDQSALGSWGETVTYNPENTIGHYIVGDTRPLYVASKYHNYDEYGWSGNIGGSDYLHYVDGNGRYQSLTGMKVNYRSQAPSVTDVVYSGKTEDGKIAVNYRINMGSTDDITRPYLTMQYDFIEDVDFERMTFFQYQIKEYSTRLFQKFIYGNSEGIINSRDIEHSNPQYPEYENVPGNPVPGSDQFFMFYDSKNVEDYPDHDKMNNDENSNALVIVRDYDIQLNGKGYDPVFNYLAINKRDKPFESYSCEIKVPGEVKTIKKGSSVKLKVEFCVLPASVERYYGYSDYLLAETSLFNTTESAITQVINGKTEVKVTTGKLAGNYPIEIDTAEGQTAAEFTLKGGLGYVPVSFRGLKSYKSYALQVLKNGVWTNVFDSAAKDYSQCKYDAATNTYTISFTVKNTVGTEMLTENRYRLINE